MKPKTKAKRARQIAKVKKQEIRERLVRDLMRCGISEQTARLQVKAMLSIR